jgi:ankyrin repeat protein
VDGQQQLEEREHQEGQQEPHCLDLSDAAGNTSLHLAAVAAQLEAARLLIDAGASLNLQNRWA